MRNISTIVKSYYDTAAVPVTAAEAIAHAAVDDDRRSMPNWAFAVAAATIVIVLLGGLSFLLSGSDGLVEPAGPGLETTVPTPVDNIANAMLVTPPIDVEWTLEATLDDWLTEPVLVNREILAIRKGIEGEGLAEGVMETTGELWKSSDGVTWIHVEDSDERTTPPTRDSTSGGAVVVEYHVDPMSYDSASGVADRLVATSDGSTWREINLRPFQDHWIPRAADGVLGWFVYSPPRANTEHSSSPWSSNLGLWYTPDTEVWFEVTDLGPLDSLGSVGAVGVMDMAIVVRDDDAFVFAHTAENVGFGVFGQPKTEIWRLELANYPTEGSLTTTPMTVSGEWNPILATTHAKTSPPAAMCPAGTNPDAPGPQNQDRPGPPQWANQAAVFDRHTGRVVYVDDVAETWTFDVCTNTWQKMTPEQVPFAAGDWYIRGELVYDVDSDRTISFGDGVIAVYNAATNTWTQRDKPPEYDAVPGRGAIYDPVSGLVIVQTSNVGLVAYDVDTDEWTRVGTVRCAPFQEYDPDTGEWTPAEPVDCFPNLVGYDAATDRLVLVGFQTDGMLVDARSGKTSGLDVDGSLAGGAFGRFYYATSSDTVKVQSGGDICQLDATNPDGRTCITPPIGSHDFFEAMVGDPINHRIVLISSYCCGMNGESSDDVWAIDFDASEWTELLARSNQ